MDKLSGIESNFLKSWNSWDEIDTGDLQFEGIKLRPEVFGSNVCEKFDGGFLAVVGSKNRIELYSENSENVAVFKKIVLDYRQKIRC